MAKKLWWLLVTILVFFGFGAVYQPIMAQSPMNAASPLVAAGFTCIERYPVSGRIYVIQNASTGQFMNVLNSGGDGSAVVQYPFNGGLNEEWIYDGNASGAYISPQYNTSLYLDIAGTTDGAQIIVKAQKTSYAPWTTTQTTFNGQSGYVKIGNLTSSMYFGIQNGSTELLANVVQYANEAPDYMKWQLLTQPVNGACPSGTTPQPTETSTATATPPPFSCVNVTEIPQIECDALVALYNSTNGANWTNHTGWLVTLTPCSWVGVTCTNNLVTQLSLNLKGLSGSIPTQLSSLTNLQYLYLSENQLSGSIPAQLSSLMNLHSLNLEFNQLSGSIPVQLGSLTNLQDLLLYGNQLSGSIPAQLGSLTNLQYLNLGYNQLSGGIPTQLGNLTNLQNLLLSENQLSGALPDSLINLTKLTSFAFDITSLCEPTNAAFQAWLAHIPNLQRTGVQCAAPTATPTFTPPATNTSAPPTSTNTPAAPIADFSASPLSGNVQLLVSFHNSSTGSIVSCSWNYGDGQTGNSCAPDHGHMYTAAGSYTVQLTVAGPGGTGTKVKSNYIAVAVPSATPTFTPLPTSTSLPPTSTSTPLPPTSTSTPAPSIDDAKLATQGDYTTVGPGESVHIWINVLNIGNTTWRASDGYGWRGTDEWSARNGSVWRDVPPGDVLSFTEDITAPSQPGEYKYGFILRHSGQDFGPYFFIKVTVKPLPVVLVHDWNNKAASWVDYTGKFLPSIGLTGYAAIMYTGADDIPPWSIDDNAKSLTLYIQRIKRETGAKRVDIVAHGMGGLIARRYIGKYMSATTPDVHQLIMLGTPNSGSLTAVANQLAYYLGLTSNPSAAELTPASVGQFNLNPENSNHHGVPFYVIAGNYFCLTKFPSFNPLEGGFNDIFVGSESAFAIPLDGKWVFPGVIAACKGYHRGMLDDASDDGGRDIFNQYVKPLLQGGTSEQANVQASKIGQKDNTLQVLDTMSQVQFTGVQAGTLRPGTQLTFSHSSESTSRASFLVVGPPDQMSVSLRDPNGQLILPNTSNPAIQYTQMDKNILPFTSYTISNPVPGMWTTIVEANAQTPAVGVGVAALGSLISDLRLTLPVAESSPLILQPVNITAQLQNGNSPLVGATVNAQISFPDHTVQQITLLDDGLHGDGNAGDGLYGYQFTPVMPGVYSASISAQGVNGNTTFQRSAVWATQVDGNQVFLPVILRR